MTLLDRLFGHPKPTPPPPKPDRLRDLVEQAAAANQDAWEEINRNRLRRGERPLAPAWEELAEMSRDERGSNGHSAT